MIPAKYARPYSKGQKNDFNDAEAIAEAVQRPMIKFVAIKTAEHLDLQALHRMRERLVSQRTGRSGLPLTTEMSSAVRSRSDGPRPEVVAQTKTTRRGASSTSSNHLSSLDPLERQDPDSFASINRALVSFRLDRKLVAIDRVKADLISPKPATVPLNVNVVDNFAL